MELDDVLRCRRMVRSYADRPLPPGAAQRWIRASLRAPSAGNSKGVAWVLLEGAEETSRYWLAATTPEWRARSRRWPGLSRAGAVAVSFASPAAYLARYAEPDKSGSGLAHGVDAWPVPYWYGDAAFSTMSLLLCATAEGAGACFLGNFRGEDAVKGALGVPGEWRLFGAVTLGVPDGEDRPSGSLSRGPRRESSLFVGRWGVQARSPSSTTFPSPLIS